MQKGNGMSKSGRRAIAEAFTLIELLVVIGIIAVLVAIGFTVATTVLASGRAQATQSTMIAIESVVQELTAVGQRPKDYRAYEYIDGNRTTLLPIIDGRADNASVDKSSRAEPSLGRLLRFARETAPGIESRWQQLDASSLRETNVGGSLGGTAIPVNVSGTEVLDQWGNPIRFVHPSFDGGGGEWYDSEGDSNSRDLIGFDADGDGNEDLEFRRSFRPFDPTAAPPMDAPDPVGDADEGICPGGSSGYLYSAGPDGDPGTRADNVYASVQPEYPAETAGQE